MVNPFHLHKMGSRLAFPCSMKWKSLALLLICLANLLTINKLLRTITVGVWHFRCTHLY